MVHYCTDVVCTDVLHCKAKLCLWTAALFVTAKKIRNSLNATMERIPALLLHTYRVEREGGAPGSEALQELLQVEKSHW